MIGNWTQPRSTPYIQVSSVFQQNRTVTMLDIHVILYIFISVRERPIFHTLYFTLHCARGLSNVVLTTVIEMVEILDGRVRKRSVERVRYVINNLLHLVIVKYGVISLVLCISTRLWLMKY